MFKGSNKLYYWLLHVEEEKRHDRREVGIHKLCKIMGIC